MTRLVYVGDRPAIHVAELAGHRFIDTPDLWEHLGVDEYDGVVPQGVPVDVPDDVAVELLELADWVELPEV